MKYTKKANGTVVCSFSKEELAKNYSMSVLDVIHGRKPREISRLMRDATSKIMEMEGEEIPFLHYMQVQVQGDKHNDNVILQMEPISPEDLRGFVPAFGQFEAPEEDDWEDEYGDEDEQVGCTYSQEDEDFATLFGSIPDEETEGESLNESGLYNVDPKDLQMTFLLRFSSLNALIEGICRVGVDEDFHDSRLYKDKGYYILYLHGDKRIVSAMRWRLSEFCDFAESIDDESKLEYMDLIMPSDVVKKLRQIDS